MMYNEFILPIPRAREEPVASRGTIQAFRVWVLLEVNLMQHPLATTEIRLQQEGQNE